MTNDKLPISGLAAVSLMPTWAQRYEIFSMGDLVTERLSPGGDVSYISGLPVNGVFFFFAALFTAAFVTFWALMLVDCLRQRRPGRIFWLLILITSLPLGLYWLSSLMYYLLVGSEADRPAGRLRCCASWLKSLPARLRKPRPKC